MGKKEKEHEFVECINVVKTLFEQEENVKIPMCG